MEVKGKIDFFMIAFFIITMLFLFKFDHFINKQKNRNKNKKKNKTKLF